MRLIDADALEVFVKTVRQGLYLDKTLSDIPIRDSMLLNFQQYVHLQPTIDAVPVVRGEWIAEQKSAEYCEFRCSVCDYSIGETDQFDETEAKQFSEWYKYCPCCGARMEDKQ
jgi:hypothetical protein